MSTMGKNDTKRTGGAATSLSGLSTKLSYYTLLALVTLISCIPFGVLYVLSDIIYFPFYHIVRYRRKIVRRNLTESFPDKSLDEIVRIEKRFYHFFIDTTLESCKLATISREEMMRRIKFTNIELANDMLRQGKSVSLFMGHYGNWEWVATMSLWLYKGAVIAQLYRKLNSKSIDGIMRKLRERMGSQCVDMHNAVRFMATVAAEHKPCIIGFIADQSPKKREAKYFIPFLNHNVPVMTGTEKTTKHYGYEALFLNVKRVKRGYYECELSRLHEEPRSLPNFELTTIYFQHLEREIVEHPEMYLWTHKRFKYASLLSPQAD